MSIRARAIVHVCMFAFVTKFVWLHAYASGKGKKKEQGENKRRLHGRAFKGLGRRKKRDKERERACSLKFSCFLRNGNGNTREK